MADVLKGEAPLKEEIQQIVAESGIKETSAEVLGPFSDIANRIADAILNAFFPSSTMSSLWWPLLALTAVITALFWLFRRGRGAKDADGRERQMTFFEYLVPKRIYTHQSARVDIGLYILDKGMMHKTEIGWAIHKVHHSAQVLTPLTRPREHFIAGPIWALGPAIGLSLSGGIFAWAFDGNITRITIVNMGVFSFLYALNGNFRHYHVSFRYPRWLEYWLQSPGMHHTHHSYLEKHWDTNLGLVTSIWDRVMGTLYIPGKYEETPWGLAAKDQQEYTTLRDNLTTPFKEIIRILRGKPKEATQESR